MLTEERLVELEAVLRSDASDAVHVATSLLGEIRRLHQKVREAERLEAAYVDEIHRLNELVRDLIEYVESVAEIAQDDSRGDDVSSDIKRRAVNLIITSVRNLRELEREKS